MRELINRVTVTDGDTATALRVIEHFDRLVEGGASREAVLRAAAALAGAPVGLVDRAAEVTVRVHPTGGRLSGPRPRDGVFEVSVDQMATSVWLERSGAPGPLDQLVLERCAHALRLRRRPGSAPLTAEQLTAIACDPDAAGPERVAAIAGLHLPADVTVLVLAGHAPPAAPARTRTSQGWVVMVASEDVTTVCAGAGRVGSARLVDGDVPAARARAGLALELTVAPEHGGPVWVRHEDLGALRTIADHLTAEQAAAAPAVVLLEELRRQRAWVPQTYRQVAAGASVRHAAQVLHLHHSTLQDRLEWLESRMGQDLSTGEARLEAASTWALWRVSGLLHHR